MDKKIVKNYLYSAAYRILVTILPLITTPYVSRILRPEGVGVYSYTSSIAAVFTLFAALGFVTYGQREVAYRQDDFHARSVLFYEICIFRIITTLVALTAFFVFSLFYKKYTVYLIPQCMTIISVMFDISWYYQGLENFKITVIRNLVIKLISVICIFLFVKTTEDLLLYIIILSASSLFSNIIYLFDIRKHIERIPFMEIQPFRHIRGTIEFFIPLIAVEIYSHLDRVMLGYLVPTTEESGYYEQARKITAIVVGTIVSINSVIMPRISKLFANNDRAEIKTYYRRSFQILLLLMIPVCTGLVIISDNFVKWFFGAGFDKVAVLMKLSALLIVFMCIGNFFGVLYLIPTRQQNKMTIAYISAALCNIILNVLLIPKYKSVGALIASIIAEGVSCLVQYFLYKESDFKTSLTQNCWKYILSSVSMIIAIGSIHRALNINGIAETVIDVFVGIVIYGGCLFVLDKRGIVDLFKNN